LVRPCWRVPVTITSSGAACVGFAGTVVAAGIVPVAVLLVVALCARAAMGSTNASSAVCVSNQFFIAKPPRVNVNG
jgi:hypothetical protein